MRKLTIPLALLCLVGCASSPSETGGAAHAALLPVPGSRTLAIGDVVQVGGTAYQLHLDSLHADSRCPVDVQCVWEGEFVVDATLHAAEGLGMPDVQLTIGTRTATTAAGLTFRVTAVTPAPHAGVAIPPTDYRMTLEVDSAS